MRMKVRENERLVRESSNFAILNTDRSALSSHDQKMARLRRDQAYEEELNNIKRDVTEIKDLLRQLLKQSN
jgi:hypothetical protein